jgi:ribulose-phosphate 3-epimerase
MSVHAGFGGQSFLASVLYKYDEIRSLPGGEEVLLEIDGGINVDTIGQATEQGAQLLVAGSAVFKQEDYAAAIENLMSQVKCYK